MRCNILYPGILLCFVTFVLVIVRFITSDRDFFAANQTGDWSNPVLLYASPDTVEGVGGFQMDVYGDTIRFVTSSSNFINNRYLDFSLVHFFREDDENALTTQQLSFSEIPSEQPIILRDHSGILHVLWGDRRIDPDFTEWDFDRPQLGNYSTNVIYSQKKTNSFEKPEPIYEGNLSNFGVGDIGFPLRMTKDDQHRLHAVFKADSTFKAPTPDGEEVDVFVPYVTYMYKDGAGEWSEARFLEVGSNPGIAALPDGRLVIGWFGSDPNQAGVNDVLVITTDDGGETWSDHQVVFLSGQQMGVMLELVKSPDGTLHLVWGRQTSGLPIPGEVWHSYSEDEGETWSEPVRFFQLEESVQFEPTVSSESQLNFITNFDVVADTHNRIYWAGVEARDENSDRLTLIHQSIWDPVTKEWNDTEELEFAVHPRGINFAFDEISNRMYLFWEEMFEEAIYYSVQEVGEPAAPDVVAESGPLQLHANYPNPFNPATVVPFTLEEGGDVELIVYDVLGRQVVRQELGNHPAGFHQHELNLDGLTSGPYVYEIILDGRFRQQETMLFVK